MANLYQLHTDWCVRCGAEHSYMAGPCNKCGGKVFKKNPAVR